jgi:hypothetical protein
MIANPAYQIQQVMGSFSNIFLNSIQLQFSNGKTSYQSPVYGTSYSTGKKFAFTIPFGQFITLINLCIQNYLTVSFKVYFEPFVTSIQFKTNKGVQSPTYGTPVYTIYGTDPFIDPEFVCYNINLPAGLLGLRGFSMNAWQILINDLNFLSNQAITYSSISSKTLTYSSYSNGMIKF